MRARPIVALLILLASARVAAEPAPYTPTLVQTVEPRLLCIPPAPPSTCRELPSGRFLDEQSWQRIDVEQRELQDAKTRLTAENRSLRESASGWQPGWKTIALTLATGISLGWYITR